MIKDGVLSRLADISIVQTNIQRILGYGRGVVPKDKLHKLNAKSKALDLEFVDLMLETESTGDQQQEEIDIADKVKRAKAALATKTTLKTSVTDDGAVVVNPPKDVPEHVKKTKTKTAKKKVTRKTKNEEPTDK